MPAQAELGCSAPAASAGPWGDPEPLGTAEPTLPTSLGTTALPDTNKRLLSIELPEITNTQPGGAASPLFPDELLPQKQHFLQLHINKSWGWAEQEKPLGQGMLSVLQSRWGRGRRQQRGAEPGLSLVTWLSLGWCPGDKSSRSWAGSTLCPWAPMKYSQPKNTSVCGCSASRGWTGHGGKIQGCTELLVPEITP